MSRIVILAQERDEVGKLRSTLVGEGHDVSLTSNLEEVMSSGLNSQADLIFWDTASLPLDGVEARALVARCKESRLTSVIALIPLEKANSYDFTPGVDDFILCPYSPVEVITRARKALGHLSRVDGREILRCGDLMIDLSRYEVWLGKRQVFLTFKEYELLRFLMTNPGKVYTRETLLNRVWGYDFFGGTRTVDVHVRRLRSKIEDIDHSFIETVRNVGYRFKEGT